MWKIAKVEKLTIHKKNSCTTLIMIARSPSWGAIFVINNSLPTRLRKNNNTSAKITLSVKFQPKEPIPHTLTILSKSRRFRLNSKIRKSKDWSSKTRRVWGSRRLNSSRKTDNSRILLRSMRLKLRSIRKKSSKPRRVWISRWPRSRRKTKRSMAYKKRSTA